MLINCFISYIKETVPDDSMDHNFHNILTLLRLAGRDDDSKETPVSLLMDELDKNRPNSWSVKQFKNVNQAPEKTFNTIVSSAVAKFSSIDTEEVAEMMKYDEIDLPSIGQKRQWYSWRYQIQTVLWIC